MNYLNKPRSFRSLNVVKNINDNNKNNPGMGINVTENEETEYSEEVHEQTSSKEIVAGSWLK